ncbi:MAG: NAD(P) transhydrogenase subunit alpha part 2 [Sulfobacillus sp.]
MVTGNLVQELLVFMLAVFVGFQLISKVPSVLHTPLMSATNAIHGVIVIGALVVCATAHGPVELTVGAAAVFLGTLNVVGGYVVTDRMLEMFRHNRQQPGNRP